MPFPLQITAEQILRESKALQEAEHKAPVIKITDPEELAEYRLQVRGRDASVAWCGPPAEPWLAWKECSSILRPLQRCGALGAACVST